MISLFFVFFYIIDFSLLLLAAVAAFNNENYVGV